MNFSSKKKAIHISSSTKSCAQVWFCTQNRLLLFSPTPGEVWGCVSHPGADRCSTKALLPSGSRRPHKGRRNKTGDGEQQGSLNSPNTPVRFKANLCLSETNLCQGLVFFIQLLFQQSKPLPYRGLSTLQDRNTAFSIA